MYPLAVFTHLLCLRQPQTYSAGSHRLTRSLVHPKHRKTRSSRFSPAVKNTYTTNFASRSCFSPRRLRIQSPCFECYCLLLMLSPIKSHTRAVTVARTCGLDSWRTDQRIHSWTRDHDDATFSWNALLLLGTRWRQTLLTSHRPWLNCVATNGSKPLLPVDGSKGSLIN